MKLIFPIFAMALAAMGPAREGPVPSLEPEPEPPAVVQPQSPQEAPQLAETTRAEPVVQLPIHGAGEVTPQQFLWKARPIVIFADTPEDPAFREQLQALEALPEMLVERDVVVITDADPSAASAWRQSLRPTGFSLVLMDKDGQVKLRKPFPWDVREISRAIDKFPLRRQEIRRGSLLR